MKNELSQNSCEDMRIPVNTLHYVLTKNKILIRRIHSSKTLERSESRSSISLLNYETSDALSQFLAVPRHRI